MTSQVTRYRDVPVWNSQGMTAAYNAVIAKMGICVALGGAVVFEYHNKDAIHNWPYIHVELHWPEKEKP